MADDWAGAPSFGARRGEGGFVLRPSAYGIIEDAQGRIAVVRTRKGTFLPGGGVEDGETAEEAVRREVLEECGLVVRTGEWSARAVQFSRTGGIGYEKRSWFFECASDGPGSTGGEPDHELRWVEARVAASTLSHGSHRWAVGQWIMAVSGPRD